MSKRYRLLHGKKITDVVRAGDDSTLVVTSLSCGRPSTTFYIPARNRTKSLQSASRVVPVHTGVRVGLCNMLCFWE